MLNNKSHFCVFQLMSILFAHCSALQIHLAYLFCRLMLITSQLVSISYNNVAMKAVSTQSIKLSKTSATIVPSKENAWLGVWIRKIPAQRFRSRSVNGHENRIFEKNYAARQIQLQNTTHYWQRKRSWWLSV